jgi:predicted nucleic acid-binding protein
MSYLLDSNAIIDYLAGVMPASAMTAMHNIVNGGFCISVITHIETLSFESGNPAVDATTSAFVKLAALFDLNPDIVKETIVLRKFKKKLKTPDAIIAATAIVYNLTLLTRNSTDFSGLPGLNFVNPHTL